MTIKCPKCQHENPDTLKFCGECGTQLSSVDNAQVSFTKTLETPSKGIIPGTTFASRYKVIEELGRGGMGVVYKADDNKLKRTVAIKLLPPELTGDKEARERFMREAQSAAVLDHPNICTIYEVDESEDKTFISMAYVDGQNLREKVKAGPLEMNEGLDLAIQTAEGLTAAHKKGIVHRDIKSANIMVTKQGQAKIMDFGLAKPAGATLITREGVTMGTVAYMSPEQAQGKPVDHRSDIWSLGVVLYEIFGGRLPFQGETEASFLYSIVHEDPTPLKEINPDIPIEIQKVISKALKKKPEARYHSADEMADDLRQFQNQIKAEEAGLFNFRTLSRRLKQPKYAIPAVIFLVFITAAAFWFFNRQAKIRWAKEVLVPEVERLVEAGDRYELDAYKAALEAVKYLPRNPKLEELFRKCSVNVSFETEPPGADLYIKEYSRPDDEWTFIGVSPLKNFRVAIADFRWKAELEGYEPLVFVSTSWWWEEGGGWGKIPRNFLMALDKIGSAPQGMVRFRGLGETGDFFVDRFEVTNGQYKEFINQGGYTNREFWKNSIIKDGRKISWEEAMALFVDQTGRPGPSTWRGGDYPEGQEDYPVGGVSWYEAAAYAESVGKSLPTVHHWTRAAGLDLTNEIEFGEEQLGIIHVSLILSLSNFSDKGPSPVGSYKGLTTFGIFDMAGNVREWCWNESQDGRCVRGGGWTDANYMFRSVTQADPFVRLPNFGFRCFQYHDPESLPDFALDPVIKKDFRNFYDETPVPDEIFEIYKNQFAYDPIELDEKIETEDDSSEYWLKQKITFNAAYDDERVIAYLFLPKKSKPPYQAVVYFPSSAAVWTPSSENIDDEFNYNLDYIVKNGRAVLYPVYKGTYERNDGLTTKMHSPNESHEYSSWLIKWIKDLKRSIDYLEIRDDIDMDKLAYYGYSWGGLFGSIIPAVEERLKISILHLGGLLPLGSNPNLKPLPESDPINYVTRVRIPTLMLNGRYDIHAFPYEACVKPMYDLLGTPEEDKNLKLYETDHFIPRDELIKEILAWLDRYFGIPNNR